MKISQLKPLEKNPFKVKDDKQIEKIAKSISDFERMMSIRPIIIDEANTILGGNKRYFALKHLGYKEIPDTWVKQEIGLTEEQKREFIVKDNAHWGSEWDYDMLQDWNVSLDDWGVDAPEWGDDDDDDDRVKKATEILSGLKYEPIYYEPKEKPNIILSDCIDLEKFNAKVKALDEYQLTEEQKNVLKMFAYRFIKIDFESVANYYSFNASEEEQKAIERLRLVLTDTGLN